MRGAKGCANGGLGQGIGMISAPLLKPRVRDRKVLGGNGSLVGEQLSTGVSNDDWSKFSKNGHAENVRKGAQKHAVTLQWFSAATRRNRVPREQQRHLVSRRTTRPYLHPGPSAI